MKKEIEGKSLLLAEVLRYCVIQTEGRRWIYND